MKPDEFKKLITQLAEGSELAARKLAEAYTPHVTQFVRSSMAKRIRPKLDSEDCVQSVWASILINRKRLVQFQEPEQLIRYLAVMAKHKVFDVYRNLHTDKNNIKAEQRIQTVSDSSSWSGSPDGEARHLHSPDPSPSQVAIEQELWERLGAISSDRDKEVVSMRIKGWSYQVIAKRLSVSEKTIQRTLDRLLGALQQ